MRGVNNNYSRAALVNLDELPICGASGVQTAP
jgi:hypothetical protein